MSGQFLSQVERERLQSFPDEITQYEIITFFTLSDKDLALVKKRSGDHNLLGFALQLGTLRYLSFIPDNFPKLPSVVIEYVAQQLEVSPTVLTDYGERSQTRTSQLQEIQDYLGFRKPNKIDYQQLGIWLLERAMEHDRPLLLFQLLIKKLEIAKIIRPGLTILERMIATARNEAWTETALRLQPILTEKRSQFLDSLLEVEVDKQRTPLAWLRTGAVSNSPKAIKSEVCHQIQVSEVATNSIELKKQELSQLLSQFNATFQDNEQVRIEKDKLVVSPFKAEEVPDSTKQLRKQIRERLPWIELTNLIIEIDNLTGFSQALVHAADAENRIPDIKRYLYAAIIAQGCNIGLERMARLASLSYHQLAWCNNWYLRESTLKAANTKIVNFQYHLPLSQIWGSGTLSSSDGQRFPVSVKNRMAVSLPRYFGYGQGVSFYSWTSDQFSQYGSKPTISTMRDSTYVLDEILDNETELPIMEHTTDTAGYTELVFAMFDLLGLQFSPRIKDLGSQRLYRAERDSEYQHIESLLSGAIKTDKILPRWDDMLRVAGSLKLGWVTASLFISKLKSFPQQNDLASSFAEYGRMIKTIFILRYLMNQPYRRKINSQLNKGERLHDLRRFLFFAHQAAIRQRQEEELTNQASCLNLITNAVVTWNTLYMEAAINQLRREGHQINDEDISRLSPTRYEHLNPYGIYPFDIEKESRRVSLRPLRKPSRN
jgi:TnpA family transposase